APRARLLRPLPAGGAGARARSLAPRRIAGARRVPARGRRLHVRRRAVDDALIQDTMVHQLHWLTPQQFIDGLALGQFTPGPILMVAAYVGYTIAGLAGAVVGAAAAFLPSFVLMLALLPVFERVRALGWARAAMRGIAL